MLSPSPQDRANFMSQISRECNKDAGRERVSPPPSLLHAVRGGRPIDFASRRVFINNGSCCTRIDGRQLLLIDFGNQLLDRTHVYVRCIYINIYMIQPGRGRDTARLRRVGNETENWLAPNKRLHAVVNQKPHKPIGRK